MFVYTANSGTGNWAFQTMLQSADATADDRFGAAVSLSGKKLRTSVIQCREWRT